VSKSLRTAASQFPVSGDMAQNAGHIVRHIRRAASEEADIVHFPECSLPGYARVDFPSFGNRVGCRPADNG